MDAMNEPKEPRKAISSEDWKKFLSEFVERNKDRRARFDIFRENGETEEEALEAHLADIVLKSNGDATNVEVIRIDEGDAEDEKTSVLITNLRGLRVQYDTDGSADALEFIDDKNTLAMLRFESKVDGVS